ncbi:hypothetical protein F2Q68_00016376 [Brassica cretica]|uniref:Uncharacterized protein n=1 Tax=Brassica cretica TaxID=69181 RepID=A0A8S9HQH0_BRACR|nr:hypothetical protein F2Q68_00016376 [Brassica cretica]
MEGFPYRKFFFSRRNGVVPGTGPRILRSRDLGYLRSGDLSIFPNSLPLTSRFCHRTRGITCALKSTGVAHSQQAFPRQDITPAGATLWASDGVLETAEPGAPVIYEEGLMHL